MTFVVGEDCINCKHTDCVEVCPVDCIIPDPAHRESRAALEEKYAGLQG